MTRTLLTLPDDVIVYSLSFLDPMNIFAYSLSCKTAYRSHFLNEMLWRFLCESTGKLHLQTTSDNWFQTYSFNAIVPDDVHSLEAAIAASKPGSVVVIRGGTNHTLSGCIIDKSLRIEVFPPESIATIVSPPGSKNVKNKPIFNVTEGATLQLTQCRLMHNTPGADIWRGNCALFCQRGRLVMHDCAVQSKSGRGIINVAGGVVSMTNCTIHDCAATGVYVGDGDSSCTFENCNVVRCGGGGGEIPHGHSGVYVETGETAVVDSFLGGNALTGVSVVRGGKVVLKYCDIVGNGAEAITVEDTTRGSTAVLEDNWLMNNGAADEISPTSFDTVESRRSTGEKGLRGPSVMYEIAKGSSSSDFPETEDDNSGDGEEDHEIVPLLPPPLIL